MTSATPFEAVIVHSTARAPAAQHRGHNPFDDDSDCNEEDDSDGNDGGDDAPLHVVAVSVRSGGSGHAYEGAPAWVLGMDEEGDGHDGHDADATEVGAEAKADAAHDAAAAAAGEALLELRCLDSKGASHRVPPCPSSLSVGAFKRRLGRVSGVEPRLQRLIYGGRQLGDEAETLEHAKVRGSKRGQGGPPPYIIMTGSQAGWYGRWGVVVVQGAAPSSNSRVDTRTMRTSTPL
jgi:hypothetical protein